ncbi:hypothetical protein J6590_028524 [Homalodisca vitripennis]|nr:hypothetical protein J6590_028524 [Homalodisca vitripennis]
MNLIKLKIFRHSNENDTLSGDHFWLVHTFQLNLPLGTANADGLFPNYQRFFLALTRMCHPLSALTGEASSELASPFSGDT